MISQSWSFRLAPSYKKCPQCFQYTFNQKKLCDGVFFSCLTCSKLIKWSFGNILAKIHVKEDDLLRIITMFLDRKTPSECNSILKYEFIDKGLNLKTVEHYYNIFNRIAMQYYLNQLDSIQFEGEVEIDESHLFKPKPSKAPHRNNSLNAVWLFGICQRSTRMFIVFPVSNREETNLIKTIFKFIKIGATIFSDCFSSYVNNQVFPRQSKLAAYNYKHKYVNHKQEFVSALFRTTHTNNIENLWKLIKQEIRRQKITKNYIPAIARFLFFKTSSREEQIKIMLKALQSNELKDFEELVDIISNKF